MASKHVRKGKHAWISVPNTRRTERMMAADRNLANQSRSEISLSFINSSLI